MAPSSKRVLIAFLLAFAVAAAALQPSAAAAVGEAVARPDQEAAVSTSAAGGVDAAQQPTRPGWPGLPNFPPLPPFPSLPPWPRRPIHCIPGVPRLPFLPPCPPPSPPSAPSPSSAPSAKAPAECGTPLKGLMPCAGFLTNASVTAPGGACCDGLKAVVKDASVCFCHITNGDFSRLLPAPMLRLRMLQLPRVCGAAVPRGTLLQCIRGPVPPMNPPPSSPGKA
ncbi:hypothetical protein ACP70R_022946 [Stipagrostis hirtigluma subsp. patula]